MTEFLEKIQGLFSKSFIVASFLPVFVATFINASIAFATVPNFREFVIAQKPANNVETIINASGVLFAVGVVAFLLSSLTTFQRELLEGKHWHSKKIAELFICMQEAKREALEDELQNARIARRDLRRRAEAWPRALRDAREPGRLVEERRDQHPVRRRPREIGHGDQRAGLWGGPNRIGGKVLEALPPEWGPKASHRFLGQVRNGRRLGGLDDVEVEPWLQHELELFLTVRNGEIAGAVGHG